jgi:hypothetical protein
MKVGIGSETGNRAATGTVGHNRSVIALGRNPPKQALVTSATLGEQSEPIMVCHVVLVTTFYVCSLINNAE